MRSLNHMEQRSNMDLTELENEEGQVNKQAPSKKTRLEVVGMEGL